MPTSVLLFPLSYLSLRDEQGRPLFRRNWVAVLMIVVVVSAPFIMFDANYFGDKGFLDRFGSFSAVLTGFYIAALVGVASFASSLGDLDDEIEVGKIKRPMRSSDDDGYLTRRQYVCSMFGYLSFISLALSVIAILLIVAAQPAKSVLDALTEGLLPEKSRQLVEFVGAAVILSFNIVLAHLLVTTCYGLYYLIDRLYATKPKMLPKKAKG